ncbi:hypothetical protein [Deinococcus cellulosilyticus]|uniref:Uncharacterized protein n=1 Tax=Deinococcus cellulosilyticus (strain DSM 18568 / NBRC 106333 / KACC 11606 / 5516J-15) TaxID=1223518 RepID=A0A511N380_DEIC1|nr:hypothetical protein [Deinococcus cellulosilyticus]GEM47313.1 hypothetical protein DC3_29480 [Deinococcus cellulosilyticus NBRC 106333 = KACC 11606]
MNALTQNQQKPFKALALWTAGAMIFNTLCNQVLTYSYTLSQFPVPYFVGQLSFSAAKLTGYYQVLLQKNTLSLYWLTQYVDFFFILSVFLLHYCLTLLPIKAFQNSSKLKKAGQVMMGIALAAPLFDVLENLASFVLLQNPQHLSEPGALMYSSFAALKFGGFMVTYLWLGVALIIAGVRKLKTL